MYFVTSYWHHVLLGALYIYVFFYNNSIMFTLCTSVLLAFSYSTFNQLRSPQLIYKLCDQQVIGRRRSSIRHYWPDKETTDVIYGVSLSVVGVPWKIR